MKKKFLYFFGCLLLIVLSFCYYIWPFDYLSGEKTAGNFSVGHFSYRVTQKLTKEDFYLTLLRIEGEKKSISFVLDGDDTKAWKISFAIKGSELQVKKNGVLIATVDTETGSVKNKNGDFISEY